MQSSIHSSKNCYFGANSQALASLHHALFLLPGKYLLYFISWLRGATSFKGRVAKYWWSWAVPVSRAGRRRLAGWSVGVRVLSGFLVGSALLRVPRFNASVCNFNWFSLIWPFKTFYVSFSFFESDAHNPAIDCFQDSIDLKFLLLDLSVTILESKAAQGQKRWTAPSTHHHHHHHQLLCRLIPGSSQHCL